MSNTDLSDANNSPGCQVDPGETLSTSAGAEPSRTLGRYRLIRELGQGGMGEVWLAEQVEPVHRRVALKLIRIGMSSRDAVARFESEVQALALMDHPAIARVYDAGSMSDHRPYFAMEYVPGVPITDYCDQHRLSIRERLRLFTLVCEGVQHAHQKALIHRDLKPSNILVSEVDGRPVAKIIDFGIAKALGARLTSQTLYTMAGSLIGTPEYMSPEQALGDEDIDTRADIYSLGIVLYELLTGALPIRWNAATRMPTDELIRRLREDDAPRPSTKVRESGAELAPLAQRRQSDPQTLVRDLHGDLDAITLKALEKDRKRRYASASELAADVGRHLQDLPVTASVPSKAYRLRKFVRRHRTMAGSAVLVSLLLIVFAASVTIETVRVAHERDRADREAAAAQQTSDFLVNLFRAANPTISNGREITAREVLDAGSREAAAALKSAPATEARLDNTMGDAYTMMAEYEKARAQFTRALGIADRSQGKSSAESLIALDGLLTLERGAGHRVQEDAIASDIGKRSAALPAGSDSWARAMRSLGQMLNDRGRFGEAEQ